MLHEPGEGGSVTADRHPDNRLLVGQWLDARRGGGAIGLGHRLPIITSPAAGVAESADASVSNTDEGNLVWVQLPPPAPYMATAEVPEIAGDGHGDELRSSAT